MLGDDNDMNSSEKANEWDQNENGQGEQNERDETQQKYLFPPPREHNNDYIIRQSGKGASRHRNTITTRMPCNENYEWRRTHKKE